MTTMRDISKQILEAGMGAVDKLPGGVADGAPASDFDKEQLNKGIQHEMEHTKDAAIAEEIAKDHLKEDAQYYDKLDKAKLAGVDTAVLSAFHPFALARLALTPEPDGKRVLQKGDVCMGPDGKQYRVHDVVDGAVSATAYPSGSEMVYFKEGECKEVDPSRFQLAKPIRLPSNTSFTVYQVKPDGSLANKENLNDPDEVSEWYGKKNYGQICVINDKTGEKMFFRDSGDGLERYK